MGFGRNVRWLWLAVWCSPWSVPSSAGERNELHVILYDPEHQVPGGLGPIRRAVVEEFWSLGIEVDCPKGDETSISDGVTIPVLIRTHLGSDWGLRSDVLGTVRGHERRMVFLFFPAIEAALPGIPSGKGTILRHQRAFARPWSVGVARLIAHEILHFLLPGRPHDRTGLFREHLTEDMLLGSKLPLAPATTSALLSRLQTTEPGQDCAGGADGEDPFPRRKIDIFPSTPSAWRLE
jgi:hypothetical protein